MLSYPSPRLATKPSGSTLVRAGISPAAPTRLHVYAGAYVAFTRGLWVPCALAGSAAASTKATTSAMLQSVPDKPAAIAGLHFAVMQARAGAGIPPHALRRRA